MARKLRANVWVDGVLHVAGSEPPADVAEQIANPKAWGPEAEKPEPKRGRAKRSDDD